jgi:predicted hotdog family 3-hydroxylacyl-ACP dehydratase
MTDERDISHDVAGLVPHTGVARFLTDIVSVSPKAIEAMGAIPAGHALARHGAVPVFLAIELGAQAAAALEAIGRATEPGATTGPRMGSLVRIREARFDRPSMPVNTPIRISAELVGAAPPLAVYRLSAALGEHVVLTAVISTHAGPARSTA